MQAPELIDHQVFNPASRIRQETPDETRSGFPGRYAVQHSALPWRLCTASPDSAIRCQGDSGEACRASAVKALYDRLARHPESVPMRDLYHLAVRAAQAHTEWLRVALRRGRKEPTKDTRNCHQCLYRTRLRHLDFDRSKLQRSRGLEHCHPCWRIRQHPSWRDHLKLWPRLHHSGNTENDLASVLSSGEAQGFTYGEGLLLQSGIGLHHTVLHLQKRDATDIGLKPYVRL
jgi:hypothetical protein